MSDIAKHLSKILSAIYGSDVRQAIHDSIKQCHTDVNNPELTNAALLRAVQAKIDDGSMSTIQLSDGAITEAKLDPNFRKELNPLKYITGADGKKYILSVDVDGNLIKEEYYELPTDGLVCDIYVRDGRVINAANKAILDTFVANDDGTFIGDANKYGANTGTNILSDTLSDRTIILIADTTSVSGTLIASANMLYGLEFKPNFTEGTNPFSDIHQELSPIYEYPLKAYRHPHLNSNRFPLLTSLNHTFFAIKTDTSTSKTQVAYFDGVSDIINYTANYKDLEKLYVYSGKDTQDTNTPKFKRIIVYNRSLDFNDIPKIRKVLGCSYDAYVNSATWTRGMTGLGSPSAFKNKSCSFNEYPTRIQTDVQSGEHTMYVNGEEKTFSNVDWSEPNITTNPTKFTDLYFTNPISSLELGSEYKIEAFPYPYKINDSNYTYNVEYTSSNPSVCECYNGLLIPKSKGTTIITAKISNTNISTTREISITDPAVVDENYLYISKTYSNSVGTLSTQNPVEQLKVIFKAIADAKASGYNGVVFPKMDYHVKAYQEGVHCYIPSDMVIDFSGASMYMQDNPYCKVDWGNKTQKSYTLFSFGKSNWSDQTNGLYQQCENSTIQNLKYYGERYNKLYPDNEYSEFNNFAVFGSGGTRNCHIKNVRFDSTIGFNISTNHNGFQAWQGTSNDGAVRGCADKSKWKAGRLDSTGAVANADSLGMWYYTTKRLKLGYNYSDTPTLYTDMKYYTVGQMGTATRNGIPGFWYDIYFFDSNGALIEYKPYQMTLEKYLLPENAVYFKMNATFWGTPSSNSQTDVAHALRLWNEGSPYRCTIDTCQFINPHASAISMTGGDSCVIKNCYAEQGAMFTNVGGASFGWSIDFEDGWLNMRHNIVIDTLCGGLIANPGGYDTVYINDSISRISSGGSAQEALNIINCAIGNINCPAKTNDIYNNVTYGEMNTPISSDVSVATVRKVNCTNDSTLSKSIF